MAKPNKKSSALLIIAAAIAAVFIVKYALQSSAGLTKENARAKGNPKAAVQITEFLDFQCPACALGAKQIKEYMEQNPDKFYVQLKYFPLRMHEHAYTAARYAQCSARQGKFWPFHDLAFERQDDWKKLTVAEPAFREMVREIGLDIPALNVCLQDETVNEAILADKDEGRELGVRSTPTYFINGKMIVGYKELDAEVQSLLNEEQH